MAKNNYSIGILLIGIAVVLLLGKLGVFTFIGHMFWPLLVMAAGALLHYLYFARVLPAGVLVPGGMLVIYSFMFLLCNLFGWHSMSYLWPGFIFGVAVGLYELQMFEKMPGGLWTASVILAAVSAIFFAFTFLFAIGIYAVAAILIIIGVLLVVRRQRTW